MKTFLSKTLHIRESEYERLYLSILIYFLIVSGIVLGRNARDSLFLNVVGIKYLPYMYIMNAVFVVLCSLVYTAFIDKMDRVKFVVTSSAIFMISVIFCRIFILLFFPPIVSSNLYSKFFYSSCYVFVQIVWIIGVMQFWTFASDVFDTREAKRLFPLIGTGGLIGMIIAGLGAKYVVAAIGTENLFIVWAVIIFLSIFLVMALDKKSKKLKTAGMTKPQTAKPQTQSTKKKSQIEDFKEGLEYVKSSQLLRTMVFITLAMWVVFTIVDFQFSKEMKIKYPDKNDLTAFFGVFRGLAGMLALIVQLGFTTRIISSLGVGRAIAVHPSLLSFCAAFMSLQFGYISALTAKFVDHVTLYTVQDSSYQMLYNPIPPDRRGRARAFVEGYIKPISMGIAGVILVLGTIFLVSFEAKLKPISPLSIIAFIFALIWLFFSLRTNKGYVKSLVENLKTTDPIFKSNTMSAITNLSDEESLKILRNILITGDEEAIVFAVELLNTLEQKDAVDDVMKVINHRSPLVRTAVLSCLDNIGNVEILPEIIKYTNDPAPSVRASAAKAIGKLGTDDHAPLLQALVKDEDLETRRNAIIGLIRIGGLDGILYSAEILKEMLASSNPQYRATAASILGAIKIRHFVPSLIKMLQEENDDKVLLSIVKAMGKIKDERTITSLVECLKNKKLAKEATKSLTAYGEKIKEKLLDVLKTYEDSDVKKRVVETLSKALPKNDVFKTLIEFIEFPDYTVRDKIFTVFERITLSLEEKQKHEKTFLEYAKSEIEHIYWNFLCTSKLKVEYKDKKIDILFSAIKEDTDKAMERLFKTLGLLKDSSTIRGIWAKLKSEDAKDKPIAMEALENIGYKDLTTKITPLFDDREEEETIKLCKTILSIHTEISKIELFEKLSLSPSSWIRVCTAYTLSVIGLDTWAEKAIATLSNDEDELVRENIKVGELMS